MLRPKELKILASADGITIEFPGGGLAIVHISEIKSIDIETVPTMTVDVDLISLNYDSGELLEISDDAEGFPELCAHLSKHLLIDPPIELRFPVPTEMQTIRVYERKGNGLGNHAP